MKMGLKSGMATLLVVVLTTGGIIGVLHYIDALPPVAEAGEDIYIDIGDVADFDGSASQDEDLIYKWYFHDNSEYAEGVV